MNGGNCDWPDVNWVHALHAAWECRHEHAPMGFRARARWTKWRARRDERAALDGANLVITNSDRTRRQAVELLGIRESKVKCVYYGIDAKVFRPVTPDERTLARSTLNLPQDRAAIGFIGTLGWDRNKGFDTLFRAYQSLCADASWRPTLVAAGAGAEVAIWRKEAHGLGWDDRIRMLGFTKQIPDLLTAVDLLVAPSSYESYGLAAHEAICRGIPVMISAVAGIAERYPAELSELLLLRATDVADLAARLKRWSEDPQRFCEPVARFGEQLRQRSWEQMSAEIVELIERTPRRLEE